MKKKIVLLSLLVTCFVTACSDSSEKPFNQYGISFTCPAGWEIVETEDLGDGYYIQVEKSGFNESGVLSIITTNEPVDDSAYVDAYIEELKNQGFRNMKTTRPKKDSYGSYSGTSVEYTGSMHGILEHQGKIFIFNAKGKTLFLTCQEAVEDHKKNREGFKTIESTFRVN
ncbi:MAG: hypothetical protein LUG18_03555 [Candidatus Azobacteroides sp.]|nr:hypothetical protein [Candidatus Azobacteroides sp.]